MTDQEWEALLGIVNEFQEMFPEGLTFIGGIAVYAYAKSRETTSELAAQSHDADFVIGVPEYVELRDLVALTPNRRLSKQQFVQGGFEFDVYVEGQADLMVPVDEVISVSEERSGLRVAAIEHLLVLKADALKDRKGTSKGDKDEDDIVRVLLVSEQQLRPELLTRLDESLIAEIERAVRGDACLRLAYGNSHFARSLREKAKEKFNELRVACTSASIDGPLTTPGFRK